jgi:hypothetical protein
LYPSSIGWHKAYTNEIILSIIFFYISPSVTASRDSSLLRGSQEKVQNTRRGVEDVAPYGEIAYLP